MPQRQGWVQSHRLANYLLTDRADGQGEDEIAWGKNREKKGCRAKPGGGQISIGQIGEDETGKEGKTKTNPLTRGAWVSCKRINRRHLRKMPENRRRKSHWISTRKVWKLENGLWMQQVPRNQGGTKSLRICSLNGWLPDPQPIKWTDLTKDMLFNICFYVLKGLFNLMTEYEIVDMQ